MISENLQRLQISHERFKTNIASAYLKAEEKGATLPAVRNSESLAETIGSIEQSSSDWKPQEDWWNIDAILENDTEDYPAKMIVLLTDDVDTAPFTMNETNKIAKIRTSDGAEYTESATHVWDKTKDKECSLFYRTRYYVVYFCDTVATIHYAELPTYPNANMLYVVIENLKLTLSMHGTGNWLNNQSFLESIKLEHAELVTNNERLFCNDTALVNVDMSRVSVNVRGESCFYGCNSLTLADDLKLADDIVSYYAMFFGASSLKRVTGFSTSRVENFQECFRGAVKLSYIDCLDFASATNVTNMFLLCGKLRNIGSVANIKISGINLKDCIRLNYETLLRFIDALHDFSADTEGTHTIVLGATNLAKLTEEEIAIATNKNWTMS